MKTKQLLLAILSTFILFSCGKNDKKNDSDGKTDTEKANSLEVESGESKFYPGQEVTVKFSLGKAYDGKPWIGVIPSNIEHGSEKTNDDHDISYTYIKGGQTEGTVTLNVPGEEGKYDFRLNSDDKNGKELASISFEVALDTAGLKFEIDKETYTPDEEITISLTFPSGKISKKAWFGVIPSDIPHGDAYENDNHDVSYVYVGEKIKETYKMKAPAEAGKYDIRLNSTDQKKGVELLSKSFTVQ